jgi:hypothetical protein
LVEKGADVNAQGGRYGSALHAAVYGGHIQVFQFLMLRSFPMLPHDRCGRTLLWWAAAGGDTATVKVLTAQYNFDPRIPNKLGQTPLWIALRKGHVAVSEFLSKECGATHLQQQALSASNSNRTAVICDICTLDVKKSSVYYHCGYCLGGDWDMCADCEGRGAICEDATHSVVKCKMENGKRTEIGG